MLPRVIVMLASHQWRQCLPEPAPPDPVASRGPGNGLPVLGVPEPLVFARRRERPGQADGLRARVGEVVRYSAGDEDRRLRAHLHLLVTDPHHAAALIEEDQLLAGPVGMETGPPSRLHL